MELYYSPGACSLCPHIALHEAGLPFEAVPLFNPALPEEAKPLFRQKVADRLRYVDRHLAAREYLLGDFTVADGYLWAPPLPGSNRASRFSSASRRGSAGLGVEGTMARASKTLL